MKPWEMMRRLGRKVPTASDDWEYTRLLLHFDESSGTFVDSGPHAIGILPFGFSAEEDSKFGSYCARRTIGGGYLYLIDSHLVVGTQDFCYDLWIAPDSIGGEQIFLDTRNTSNGGGGLALLQHPGYHFISSNGSVPLTGGGADLSASDFQHVELSRTDGVLYMFKNGDLLDSVANTTDFWTSELVLGGATYYPLGAAGMNGRYDEMRLLVGKGGHTASFDPPTAAYEDG